MLQQIIWKLEQLKFNKIFALCLWDIGIYMTLFIIQAIWELNLEYGIKLESKKYNNFLHN